MCSCCIMLPKGKSVRSLLLKCGQRANNSSITSAKISLSKEFPGPTLKLLYLNLHFTNYPVIPEFSKTWKHSVRLWSRYFPLKCINNFINIFFFPSVTYFMYSWKLSEMMIKYLNCFTSPLQMRVTCLLLVSTLYIFNWN